MSDAHAEHLATRRRAGLFDFSFMGLHEFTDMRDLEALQSRALARVAPGRIAYTLLLEEDGRVFNDATVWRHPDGRWWLFSGRRGDERWIAERAQPRVRSGEHAILALQGPASGAILERVIGEPAVRSLRYFAFADSRISDTAACIGRIGYSGELGYEILVGATAEKDVRRTLLDAGAGLGLVSCGFPAANSLRIESGYVLFDRELSGRELPVELGLARLVERRRSAPAIASQRRLVGLRIEPARQQLRSRPWLPMAHVTSECDSPLFERTLALGFVAAEDAIAGSLVALQDGRAARVARLPFYDPARRLPRATPL